MVSPIFFHANDLANSPCVLSQNQPVFLQMQMQDSCRNEILQPQQGQAEGTSAPCFAQSGWLQQHKPCG